MEHILTRVPINKQASIVTSQKWDMSSNVRASARETLDRYKYLKKRKKEISDALGLKNATRKALKGLRLEMLSASMLEKAQELDSILTVLPKMKNRVHGMLKNGEE